VNDESRTPDSVRESRIFHESRRLIDLERSGDEDILAAALNGRTRDEANLVQLWRLCRVAFQATLSLPPGRCRSGAEVYWSAIVEFLTAQGWTEEQLKALRNGPLPVGTNLLGEF
jgi:hypothetical protein